MSMGPKLLKQMRWPGGQLVSGDPPQLATLVLGQLPSLTAPTVIAFLAVPGLRDRLLSLWVIMTMFIQRPPNSPRTARSASWELTA
jgi:hypothetical protein